MNGLIVKAFETGLMSTLSQSEDVYKWHTISNHWEYLMEYHHIKLHQN